MDTKQLQLCAFSEASMYALMQVDLLGVKTFQEQDNHNGLYSLFFIVTGKQHFNTFFVCV